MKKLGVFIATVLFAAFLMSEGCSSTGNKESEKQTNRSKSGKAKKDKSATEENLPPSIKEGKGVGPVENVELTDPLKDSWVQEGEAIYGKRCASCHKLSEKRVVGPGWAGISNKRKPEWIMNMMMNTEVMLAQDPEAQRQLEECMVRMPNQELSTEEARKVLEFMRKNDLEQTGKKDQAS